MTSLVPFQEFDLAHPQYPQGFTGSQCATACTIERVQQYDIAIIGGGIVGLATANALLDQNPRRQLLLVEAEARLASHQTGHNSGVIHSGLYYKPGSLKARLCAEGREAMYRFLWLGM